MSSSHCTNGRRHRISGYEALRILCGERVYLAKCVTDQDDDHGGLLITVTCTDPGQEPIDLRRNKKMTKKEWEHLVSVGETDAAILVAEWVLYLT